MNSGEGGLQQPSPDQLDETLDAYERSLGIPAVQEDEVTTEGRRLIQLAPAVLRKMSPQECGEAAFVLEQFGFRIQQAINREQARVTWAVERINKIIIPRIDAYGGYTFEEKRLRSIAANDAAKNLDVIRVKASLRLDKLAFLSNRIQSMGKTLLSIHRRGKE